MPARLVSLLALATLLSSTACGQSEPAAAERPAHASELATLEPPPPNGVADPTAERHDALPASFPRDIAIPEGLVAKTVESENAGSYVALFTGELEPETVYKFFSEHLVAEGWTIDKAQGAGPEYGLFASKGGRITTVISTRIDGQLHVELGVSGGS